MDNNETLKQLIEALINADNFTYTTGIGIRSGVPAVAAPPKRRRVKKHRYGKKSKPA